MNDAVVGSGRGTLIRNGVVAFVTGATIMILLHETSHAVAGALQGYGPTQLPFAVGYTPEPPAGAAALTAIAGPLFSIVSGLLLYGIDRVVRPLRARPYWRLVWLWTVFASLQEGFGYFMIAGLVPAGDTARAFTLWGLPTWMFFAATAFGVGGLFLTARLFADPVIELSSSITDRRAISVWPWLYGTIGLVLLMGLYVVASPPVGAGDVVAVMAGAVAVGVYAPMSMMFRSGRVAAADPPQVPTHPRAGYALLAVLVVINLVLTRGWLWV
ncbi:hypothetical protein GCM10022204_20790 [Microlunatus aurantiacus]|uniref:Peptidase M50B-like n=1 Tax=Microlunatus aurantiacus TaxID=446786 RepID=A0ABP7DHP6_9ACTN